MGPTRRLVTIRRSGADGAHFPLSLSTCLLGRSIECDIRIQLPVVSKQHCKIEVNEQEAILHNFSSTNPTQVNGSVIDEPVHLKHGDVITIIDRSFRYENESQNGSKSAEFPGKIREQEPAPQASRSSFSAGPDGKGQDSKAHSKITEGNASRSPLVHVKRLTGDSSPANGSKDSVAQGPPETRSSEPAGHNGRSSGEPSSGAFKDKSGVTVSSYREVKSFPSTQSLNDSKNNESPFKKLYQSMKEELDVKSQRQSVPQYRPKSGPQLDYTTEKERRETQLMVSCKARPNSAGSAHVKTASSSTKPDRSPAQKQGSGVGPLQQSEEAVSSSIPLSEMTKMKASVWYSQQHEDEDLHVTTDGRESVNLGKSEGVRAVDKIVTPRKLLTRNQTPAKVEGAANPGDQPENLSSKNISIPTNVEVLPTEIQNQPFLTQCLAQVEKRIQKDSLIKTEKLAATAGQICSGLPGLSSVDISNFGDSINMSEGISLKRRRVSFGGQLRPELFDENLPPNTPLKRGETPTKRKSLVTSTPTVLKKIIKEQPQSSGREESSLGTCLEVTAQQVCVGTSAHGPGVTPPRANDQKRRSSKILAASGVSETPHQTDVPKKAGRKSGNLPSKRASISRSQHDILQMICSKRRSGASEANLVVAKSWADVVKLGAKQTQTKAVKHGPQRQMNKRLRRPNTPKKPIVDVHNQFSTGHANSPCTIVIGKAQIEKVHVPARPYRMLNNFVLNQKMDYNEDLSGLTEMFKTPVKDTPQMTSMCSNTLSNSENLPGKQFQVTNSGEKPLPITSEILGENVSSSTQNAAKEPSDKYSASPALQWQNIKDGNVVKTPRNVYKMTQLDRKTPNSLTEPLKTVSSTNKCRRSKALRDTEMPPVESKNGGTEADFAEGITGRGLRKTLLRGQDMQGEVQDSGKSLETRKENVKSKENLVKKTAVRRSRTGEQKCEPTNDLSGSQVVLQTPARAEEPMNEKERTTKMPCKSSQPEAVGPPESSKRWLETPLWKDDVREEFSVPRSLAPTSGESRHTHKALIGDNKSIQVFKGAPKQKADPVVFAAGMKRRSTTPKEKTQPLEDLTGFKELFQTPQPINKPVINDKSTAHCKSQPVLVDTPTSIKTRPNTPRRKVDMTEELSALRELTHMSGGTAHTPRVPRDVRGIKPLKESAKQMPDTAASVTGNRRQRGAPQEKAQPLEDLAGFQELFQTPGHAKDPTTVGETTEAPWNSPQPGVVRTPTGTKRQSKISLGKVDVKEELSALRKRTQSPGKALHGKGSKASMETPKQKLEPTDNLTGFKRGPRTPKEKAEFLEDLAGLQELFKTPGHTEESLSDENNTKVPWKSPQPGPVRTPTGTKRQSKTSLGKVDVEKELSVVRKLSQMSGENTHTPRVSEDDDKGIRVSKQSAKRKMDAAENVTCSKRLRGTPHEKTQPLEDLAGLQDLFQTPEPAKDAMTIDKTTEVPWKSPQSGPVRTPTSTKRQSKTSLWKIDVKEKLSALRKLKQSPGKVSHIPTVPVGEGKDIKASMETPKQKLEPTDNLTGLKRRPRTPKEKAEFLEDLAGFQELFKTPGHAKDKMTVDKTTEMPWKSPQLLDTPTILKKWPRTRLRKADVTEELSALRELTHMSGGTAHTPRVPRAVRGIKPLKESAKQMPDTAASVTGNRRQRGAPQEKAQPLEDLAGFQELFQTPGHAKDPTTVGETTEVPWNSPQPGVVRTPTGTKRQSKISLGKVDVKEELSALRKRTQSPGKALHGKGSKASMETPKQKLEPTDNLIGFKRGPRTPKEKAEFLEDLAGLQELFKTPGHTEESLSDENNTKVPWKSPQPGPVRTPTGTKRQSKTSLGKVDLEEELSALRKRMQSPGKALHTPAVPVWEEKGSKASIETPKQILDSAASVTGSKRQQGTLKEEAQPLEDLVGFQDLFQTPEHAKDTMTTDKITKVPWNSPQPGSVRTPRSTKRQSKTSLGQVDVKEELSLLSKVMCSSEETMLTPKVPQGDVEGIKALKESAKQKLDAAASITGSRRQPRAPKEEALEDLAGLQELFLAPDPAKYTSVDKTTKMLYKSPQPEPMDTTATSKRQPRTRLGKVDGKEELSALRKLPQTSGETMYTPRVPGDDKGIREFKQPAKRKWDPAENVIVIKRLQRAHKAKAQLLEDLAGFQELFQIPGHDQDPTTIDKSTEMPWTSAQADTPTISKGRPRTRLRKVHVRAEPSAQRTVSGVSGETRNTHKVPTSDSESIAVLQGPAVSVTGSKRQPRAPKGKSRPLGDPAGSPELFQTLGSTADSVSNEKTTEMPCKSPQPEPAGTPTTSKTRLRTRVRKVDSEEEPPAQKKLLGTARETRNTHKAPAGDSKSVTVFKQSVKRKPGPAVSAPGSKRLRGTPEEKAQTREDLAGSSKPTLAPGHTEESARDEKPTHMPCKSLQPEQVDTPAVPKRRLRTRLGKVTGKEELLAARQTARLPRQATRTRNVPEGEDGGIGASTPGPATRVTGRRRQPRAAKEEAQPLGAPAGSKEVIPTPDGDDHSLKSVSKQPLGKVKPLKTVRRVLKVPKEKPEEVLVGTRDLATSQSKSNTSLSPKRKSGREESVSGTRRLRSVTSPQEATHRKPVHRRQRAAPSQGHLSPDPLKIKKRLRILTNRNDPVGEQNSNSREAEVKVSVTPNQRMSLRSRHQNKTDTDQQRSEFLISVEKTKIKRHEKSMKTSQEMEQQNLGKRAKKPTLRGKVSGNRLCLRSGRQSRISQPHATKESVREKSVEIPVKDQKEKGVAGNSDIMCLRSKKTGIRPRENTLDSVSEPRVTRGAKRCAENPNKDKDIVCTKKLRTRSHRNSEDIL